jgi:hypothetical protein
MSAPTNNSVQITRRPVRVAYVRPVYTYDRKMLNSVCEICQKNIEERCNQCVLVEAPHCQITIGECNHGFHEHCLETWLKDNKKCPVDMLDWKVRK